MMMIIIIIIMVIIIKILLNLYLFEGADKLLNTPFTSVMCMSRLIVRRYMGYLLSRLRPFSSKRTIETRRITFLLPCASINLINSNRHFLRVCLGFGVCLELVMWTKAVLNKPYIDQYAVVVG